MPFCLNVILNATCYLKPYTNNKYKNKSSNKVKNIVSFPQRLDRIITKTISNLKLFENYKIKD